jgi:hypothetical protein
MVHLRDNPLSNRVATLLSLNKVDTLDSSPEVLKDNNTVPLPRSPPVLLRSRHTSSRSSRLSKKRASRLSTLPARP